MLGKEKANVAVKPVRPHNSHKFHPLIQLLDAQSEKGANSFGWGSSAGH